MNQNQQQQSRQPLLQILSTPSRREGISKVTEKSSTMITTMSLFYYYIIVFGYCYKRILYIIFIIPTVIIVGIPCIGTIVGYTFDTILSNNIGCICLVITLFGIYCIQNFIIYNNNNITTTTKNNNSTTRTTTIIKTKTYARIIFCMILISSLLCRYIIEPLLLLASTPSNATLLLSLSFYIPSIQFSIQLTCISFLLGLIIISRYVGPSSLMRCSNIPLRTNPIRSSIQYMCYNSWSILLQFLSPSLQYQQHQQQQQQLYKSTTNNSNDPIQKQQKNETDKNTTTSTTTPTNLNTTTTSAKDIEPQLHVDTTSSYNNKNVFSFLNEQQHQQQQKHHHQNQKNEMQQQDLYKYHNTGSIANVQNLNGKTFSTYYSGRRYDMPNISVIIIQIIIPVIIGPLVSLIINNSSNSPTEESISSSVGATANTTITLFVCLFSILVSNWIIMIPKSISSLIPHEINIKLYLYPFSYRTEWMNRINTFTIQLAIVSIVCPIIAIVLSKLLFDDYYYNTATTNNNNISNYFNYSIKHYVNWILYSFCINVYMFLLDEMLKLYIIHRISDKNNKVNNSLRNNDNNSHTSSFSSNRVKRLIDQTQYDTTYYSTVQIFLQSLLPLDNISTTTSSSNSNSTNCSTSEDNINNEIVNYILKPIDMTISLKDKSRNQIEVEYANTLMLIISKRLVSSSSSASSSSMNALLCNVPFEEDVFRIILLESIGGCKYTNIIDDSNCISQRHNEEISKWVFNITNNNQEQQEPSIISGENIVSDTIIGTSSIHRDCICSLIRILAVYIGSYGYALTRCSSSYHYDITTNKIMSGEENAQSFQVTTGRNSNTNQRRPLLHYNYYWWTLSPTACSSLEFAIRGMTRCILKSFQHPSSSTSTSTSNTSFETNTTTTNTTAAGTSSTNYSFTSNFLLGDWTNSIVAHAIPIAMISLFTVRTCLLEYNNKLTAVTTTATPSSSSLLRAWANPIISENARLLHIVDSSAVSILHTIQLFNGNGIVNDGTYTRTGSTSIGTMLGLPFDAIQWTSDLLQQSTVRQ